MTIEPADRPEPGFEAGRPTVSVIVVSFNTRDMTLACLESVRSETAGVSYELIVVDNDSGDGSADAIAQAYPDVPLIRAGENLGFARANNLAAGRATGEYILLLNPDTVVRDDAVSALVRFSREKPGAEIWGGRTLYADGSLNPTSCWAFMSVRSILCSMLGLTLLLPNSEFFNHESYGRWKRDRVRRVDIVTGCFLLIRRDFWEQLGGFDPRYFMYAEEADLSVRAMAYGARPMMTPEATIVHYGSASEPIRAEKMVKLLCGKCTLIHTHWGPVRAAIGLWLMSVSTLVRAVCYGVLSAVARRGAAPEKASVWLSVWRRRREWVGGYPPHLDGPHR